MTPRYRERPSRLDGAVVWTLTGARPGGAARPGGEVHPVLPDGCMDLLWTEGRLLVAGPDTRAYAPDGAGAAWAGVRFAPGDAPALLGVPAHALRDRRVDLADLWPAARARRLAARVAAAPGDPATALEEAALSVAAAAPRPDPLLRAVAARLDAGWSVAATADAVGIGARQLHRRSLDAFGYGPKTLARVLRLQRALALIRAGTPCAAVAAAAGYTDQAHLTRDVRALTGRTPAAYATSANRSTPRPSGSRTTA
ncbi:helix-turn-helix domain-containing protein [Streptomyces sp. TRM76323]|uniref:Helix-turn-helix domain-containing protein n=1 Tax=Streptomyces tamarix TaxID=3078565 RepID=A0ABU3QHE2_9ACTN|nr:helix-turn-helix domain-containing protein [Streptomyces tamarix]MDT9682180.1 helix-turn-helix domain-containing protein [Streptomyces tamarix]